MTRRRQLVVVDGSNLATEGRATPSLRQLDEAVRAFLEEHAGTEVVVVVDATFEHRIAAAERAQFKQAELAGEVVTPPAGVVGRGDAFILQIAKRADAIVLSNDSFQEFHAEHPWLFEEGRLIGGKPVPHVGWIFTPRNPVRGLKSKVATTKAARAAKAAAAAVATPEVVAPAPAPRARAVKAKKPAPTRVPDAAATKASSKRAPRATEPPAPAQTAKRAGSRRARGGGSTEARKEPAKRAGARAKSTKAPTTAKATTTKARPEPVNTSRSFLRLVTDHPLGGTVEGEVVQFTSHGAMVSVPVGRTMHVVCYAPLAGLGSSPPTRARDVLQKGEVYRFTIVSFDTTRRRAELALATR
ncbi:MAG TPA: hypothetical protein VGZ03_07235 [Acidimicrobiales bacterium]|nr:hypothetical protein [Acidimicrobiales bacterium]